MTGKIIRSGFTSYEAAWQWLINNLDGRYD
jgi:hypothetical protein